MKDYYFYATEGNGEQTVSMPAFLNAIARKGVRLCHSEEFGKAAMRPVLERTYA